jgi:cytochrome P450
MSLNMIYTKNDIKPIKTQAQPIPEAKGLPILGLTIRVVNDPLGLLVDLKKNYEDVVKVKLGLKNYYLLQTPKAARHVLQENAKNYYKPGAAKLMKRILGDGLATSNGELWLKQRRLIQPAFHKHRLSDFYNVIQDETSVLINEWNQKEVWQQVDVSKAFLKLTLNNITRAMFGAGVEDQMDEIASVLRIMMDFSSDVTKSLIKIPLNIPTKKNLQFKNAEKRFEKIIYQIIEQRKEEKKGSSPVRNDLLNMLLSAYDDESHTYITAQQIRDEITTIFMAGHETTSQTLSWIFYRLALHPAIYKQVQQEVNTQAPGPLPNFAFTKAVIEEAMRFYPPVWIIARKSASDDVINGYRIPAGSTVLINVYGMHYDSEFFINPTKFNPEHFSKEIKEKLPPFSYLPFGGGQRICIGHHFAMMILQTVVSELVKNFEFKIPKGFVPTVDPNLTLRSKEGIQLLIKKTFSNASQ